MPNSAITTLTKWRPPPIGVALIAAGLVATGVVAIDVVADVVVGDVAFDCMGDAVAATGASLPGSA
ncbi:hypothetical protein O59_001581 [Cellvibrio sp. BR]|nr:hypothetical protein O59_001581 [Cellvibrio sp. BR]